MSELYPINGYAPGNYSCMCYACDTEFTGDKRAISCEKCALEMLDKGAEMFARERHGDQKYSSDQPYVDAHVAKVVAILREFGFDEFYIAAGWLHDVVEDTPTRREEIDQKFGERVGKLVWACSGFGPNRKARNDAIYNKIAAYPDAAIVKVADRIANIEASEPNGSHRQMYLKEQEVFYERVAIYAPRPLRDRLEAAYFQSDELAN